MIPTPDPVSLRRRGQSLAAASLLLVVALLAGCGGGAVAPDEGSGSTLDAAPSDALTGPVFTDDFDSGSLDPVRWSAPAHPDLIRVADGVLKLQVTAADTAIGVEDQIDAHLPAAVREVSLAVSVAGFEATGPGGGALQVAEPSGRYHQIVFGPSGGGLEAGALVCEKTNCSSKADFVSPGAYFPFEQGQPLPLRVVAAAQRLEFYVADQLIGSTTPLGEARLSDFRIELYGANSEQWHITVDSVRAVA